MVAESNIGASFESPKQLENLDGSSLERPDLDLENKEKPSEKPADIPSVQAAVPASVPVAAPSLSASEQRQRQIEAFLSRGLEEVYLSLPPEKRSQFKRAGEETAVKIDKLLEKTRVNIGKIVNLIRKWLSILPGVNKLFLEQEAKIRTDEIMKLRKM
jgi:hypothetical protein